MKKRLAAVAALLVVLSVVGWRAWSYADAEATCTARAMRLPTRDELAELMSTGPDMEHALDTCAFPGEASRICVSRT